MPHKDLINAAAMANRRQHALGKTAYFTASHRRDAALMHVKVRAAISAEMRR